MSGALARVGYMRRAYRNLMGDLRERERLENLSLSGKILLKYIFITFNRAWTGLIWLKARTNGGHF